MSHFAKYFAIALASLSIVQAGVLNIPLPPGFPAVYYIFAQEMTISERSWNNANLIVYQNPFGPYLQVIGDLLLRRKVMITGLRFLWGQLLLEGNIADKKSFNPDAPFYVTRLLTHGSFDQKIAIGLKLNRFLFFKVNLALWDGIPVLVPNQTTTRTFMPSLCFYPSFLFQTPWFNLDIGFGSHRRLFIDPQGPQFFQQMKTAATFFLNRIDYDTILIFPIRINVSYNVLSLGS